MRKAGNRLRVTAQLVNVDGRLPPLVGALRPGAGGRVRDPGRDRREHREGAAGGAERGGEAGHREGADRRTSRPTTTTCAGRQFFHQFRRTGIQFARRMFERAIEIDPSYALAYAGIADCCSFLYMYWDASKANLEAGRQLQPQGAGAATRNRPRRTPSRGLARLARASGTRRREREFETAIRLEPEAVRGPLLLRPGLFQQGKLRGGGAALRGGVAGPAGGLSGRDA